MSVPCQLSLAVFYVCSQGELLLARCLWIHHASWWPPPSLLLCPSHGPYMRSLRPKFAFLLYPITGSSFLLPNWRLLGSVLYSTLVNTVPRSRLQPDLGAQNSASEYTVHKTESNTVWLCKMKILLFPGEEEKPVALAALQPQASVPGSCLSYCHRTEHAAQPPMPGISGRHLGRKQFSEGQWWLL